MKKKLLTLITASLAVFAVTLFAADVPTTPPAPAPNVAATVAPASNVAATVAPASNVASHCRTST